MVGHSTPIVIDNARMTIPHPKDQTFCPVGVQPKHIVAKKTLTIKRLI